MLHFWRTLIYTHIIRGCTCCKSMSIHSITSNGHKGIKFYINHIKFIIQMYCKFRFSNHYWTLLKQVYIIFHHQLIITKINIKTDDPIPLPPNKKIPNKQKIQKIVHFQVTQPSISFYF